MADSSSVEEYARAVVVEEVAALTRYFTNRITESEVNRRIEVSGLQQENQRLTQALEAAESQISSLEQDLAEARERGDDRPGD